MAEVKVAIPEELMVYEQVILGFIQFLIINYPGQPEKIKEYINRLAKTAKDNNIQVLGSVNEFLKKLTKPSNKLENKNLFEYIQDKSLDPGDVYNEKTKPFFNELRIKNNELKKFLLEIRRLEAEKQDIEDAIKSAKTKEPKEMHEALKKLRLGITVNDLLIYPKLKKGMSLAEFLIALAETYKDKTKEYNVDIALMLQYAKKNVNKLLTALLRKFIGQNFIEYVKAHDIKTEELFERTRPTYLTVSVSDPEFETFINELIEKGKKISGPETENDLLKALREKKTGVKLEFQTPRASIKDAWNALLNLNIKTIFMGKNMQLEIPLPGRDEYYKWEQLSNETKIIPILGLIYKGNELRFSKYEMPGKSGEARSKGSEILYPLINMPLIFNSMKTREKINKALTNKAVVQVLGDKTNIRYTDTLDNYGNKNLKDTIIAVLELKPKTIRNIYPEIKTIKPLLKTEVLIFLKKELNGKKITDPEYFDQYKNEFAKIMNERNLIPNPRKILKGKDVKARKEKETYEIRLFAQNNGKNEITITPKDVLPENFKILEGKDINEKIEINPEINKAYDKSMIIYFKQLTLKPGEQIELKYIIKGTGDYKASDEQFSI